MGEIMEKFKVCEVSVKYSPKVKASERYQIYSSRDLYNLLMKVYDTNLLEYKETMKLVLLNKANKVLGVHHLSEGGIDGTYCDVRQILQIALLTNSTSIAISHNHPSGGKPTASEQDKKLTAAVYEACKTINIQLLDHLIVTTESYFSFADQSLI